MSLRFFSLALALLIATGASAQRTLVTTESELRSAISGAQPGDVIAIANGNYEDFDIVFRANGVEGDSIRIEAETPGGVIFDGASSLRIAGNYLVVDGLRFEGGVMAGSNLIEFRDGARLANHSRLTNTAVIDVRTINRVVNTKWVSIYGTYNRVDHSYLAGKTNVGTTLVVWLESGSSHRETFHRIDNNHFGPRPPLGQNGGETIRIGTSDVSMQDAFVTVERNLFDQCNGEIEIISVKSGKNTIRGNTFFRSRGALTLRHGNGSLVEGNMFFGQRVDDSGGVRVIGEDHVVVNNYFELTGGSGQRAAIAISNGVPNSPLNRYFQVRNVTIAHNTIVRATRALSIGVGADSERTLPPENVRFHNNVILTAGNTIVDLEDEPTDMTWDGTIYWGGSLGIDDPPGVTKVNPLIQPSDDDIWRPLDGSPVFDAAVAVPGLGLDIDLDGQPRDGSPDIGADERSSAPITRGRLTADDVGTTYPRATPSEAGPGVSLLSLSAPYPNPTIGAVALTIETAVAGRVEVNVYDVLGRRVETVLGEMLPAGTRTLRVDASRWAAGTYAVVARSGSETVRTSATIAR